ncbi:MAG: tetratricopeptide repeat protein [Archangium sp.]|nr:tetratricopeptide repeat protein [Archangium sp.]MDP3153257.1 tetratricopeptide repeat protein [Archangium sp.]MDP3570291.1 tetratricopeptide repeat protein [Archangium sp.]
MTNFPPLSKTAATEAEQLVARAASVPPRPVDPASWDELVARAAMRPTRDARLIPAFMLAVAAGVGVVMLFSRPAPIPPAQPGLQLVATAATKWTQTSPSTVVLSAGRLSMVRAGEVRIETPHAVIEAHQSRFLAEVISSGTSLVVEEGEVVLRSGSVTRTVRAGESLVWPPSPEIPARLLDTPPVEERCSTSPAGERRSCLEAEAVNGSLDAQAALYELGVLEAKSGRSERAVEAWQQSLRRFPEGVLHPEVRLALLVELVRARRFTEAENAAQDFEKACADDPRRAEVGTLKALLSGH